MTKPLFITFEGADGSGKSSLLKAFSGFLTASGERWTQFSMLGHKKLRDIVLCEEFADSATTLLLMKAMHMETYAAIKGAMEAGLHVLADRGPDSLTVYQGHAQDLGALLARINQALPAPFEPDLTFLLDLPVKEAERRIRHRGSENGYDDKSLDFKEKVREGFLELADRLSRFSTLDATQPPDELLKETIFHFQRFKVWQNQPDTNYSE